MRQALSIVAAIFVCTAEAVVIAAILLVAKSSFETIVFSGLALIYLDVLGAGAGHRYASARKGNQDLERFIKVATALRLDTEPYEAAHQENVENFERYTDSHGVAALIRTLLSWSVVVNLIYTLITLAPWTAV